jgi:tripartite ATP-independent transporter DctP family solute receptor
MIVNSKKQGRKIMKKKNWITIVSMLCAGAFLFGIFSAQAASPTKENPLVLRFNTVNRSEGAPGSAAQMTFKKEIERLTDGRVKVEFYYGWALARSTDAVIGGLQTGGFELSDWNLASFAEYSKAFLPLDVFYLLPNKAVAYEVIRGEVGQIMVDRFKKETGIRVLMITDLGFRHITNSKRPITSPADLKGLKIRTQSNPLHLQGFKAFGASPTPMSFAELFTALQQGVVDGQENPIFMTYIVKLYKVQKYLSLTGHLFSPGAIVMSNEVYNGLPQDIRAAIDKAAISAREAAITEVAETEKAWLPKMEEEVKVNALSKEQLMAFQKIAKAQWPKMAKIIGEDYFNMIRGKIEEIQAKVGQ